MIKRVKKMKPMGLLVRAEKLKDDFIYVIEDENKDVIFKSKPMVSSANLSCFLGLCHSISILEEGEYDPFLHTNNMTALYWIEKRNVNTVISDADMVEYIKDSIEYLNNIEMEYECLHFSKKNK
jgi:hypothetical protein